MLTVCADSCRILVHEMTAMFPFGNSFHESVLKIADGGQHRKAIDGLCFFLCVPNKDFRYQKEMSDEINIHQAPPRPTLDSVSLLDPEHLPSVRL